VDEKPDALPDESPLPPLPLEVEAEIALTWNDNPVAAQMTRVIARAMSHQGKDADQIRELIRSQGRVVE
jgi:hypothetical protein